MNSIVNVMNYTAKVANSITNQMKSVAEVMNSIAKSCVVMLCAWTMNYTNTHAGIGYTTQSARMVQVEYIQILAVWLP